MKPITRQDEDVGVYKGLSPSVSTAKLVNLYTLQVNWSARGKFPVRIYLKVRNMLLKYT